VKLDREELVWRGYEPTLCDTADLLQKQQLPWSISHMLNDGV
jgi:hypothetical protein